jgi:diamine N-acetyltransferase
MEAHAIAIREVDRANWRATLELAVAPDQQRFISDYTPIAAIALAKAYIRPGGLTGVPLAFYAGERLVGFALLAFAAESVDDYWLFHFFVDARFQGQGFGREALSATVAYVRAHHPACQALRLVVHPENARAQRLYIAGGFRATGREAWGEPEYRLALAEG